MANYAYLRVSTDHQDVDNQRYGILEYCNKHQLNNLQFISDAKSSRIGWRERGCGDLLIYQAQPGDTVVFSEISRLARSTLQVLEILSLCIERKINVHIAKQNMIMDGSMQSTITATVLGLAAEIEREFIRLRTTESLAHRKKLIDEQGYFISNAGERRTSLGRPKGQAEKTKLDKHKKEIQEYLHKKIPKRSIAKLVDCSPRTLYTFIEKHELET